MQRQNDAGFGLLDSQLALHIPHRSFAIDMQPCYNDLGCSVPSPSSYGLDEIFQSHCGSDLGLHDIVDFSSRAYQNHESPGDRSVKSYCSPSTKRDSKALESDLGALSPPKKVRAMPEYRRIVPKHNNSSAEIVEGAGNRNVVRRGFKKGGRNGSLKPEKRQKATEMRDVRACASCYISHIEVC